MGHQQTVLPKAYMNRGGEPINWPSNKKRPWNDKLIRRLLLTVTVADPELFILKDKPVTYTRAFVELYNWKNNGQVHEIYEIIELEKMCTLIAKNFCNLGVHQIIEILLVLRSTHVVPKNQEKFVFYVNNYIDWDQFNQLYDSDWMKKGVKNADAVTCKLRLALTRAINDKLEAARKEKWKKKKMIERRKTEAMATKRRRARGKIGLFSKKEDESDTKDNTDPN